jgi:hypothetical protein
MAANTKSYHRIRSAFTLPPDSNLTLSGAQTPLNYLKARISLATRPHSPQDPHPTIVQILHDPAFDTSFTPAFFLVDAAEHAADVYENSACCPRMAEVKQEMIWKARAEIDAWKCWKDEKLARPVIVARMKGCIVRLVERQVVDVKRAREVDAYWKLRRRWRKWDHHS